MIAYWCDVISRPACKWHEEVENGDDQVTDEILLCFSFSVMRPPAGDYDEKTLEVLGQLGYK